MEEKNLKEMINSNAGIEEWKKAGFMTAISIVSSKTAIFPVLFYLNSTNCFVTICLYRTC